MLEYAELSKDFTFPDEIECALERDYAENPGFYDLDVLNFVRGVILIIAESTPQEIVRDVKEHQPFRTRR